VASGTLSVEIAMTECRTILQIIKVVMAVAVLVVLLLLLLLLLLLCIALWSNCL
jgi:hypothetical protein